MTPKHVSGTIKAEHIETLRKMAEQLSKNAENAERMCELLQPEFDKFEARAEPHNVYVVRDYVDHRNAAKRQRKEAEAILAAIQPDPEPETGSSKWGPEFPPPGCTAWEDCAHDGVCHDPDCGAPSQHGDETDTPFSAGMVSVEAAANDTISQEAAIARDKLHHADEFLGSDLAAILKDYDRLAALRALAGERG